MKCNNLHKGNEIEEDISGIRMLANFWWVFEKMFHLWTVSPHMKTY